MSTQEPLVETDIPATHHPDLPAAIGTLEFDEIVVPLLRDDIDDRGLAAAASIASKLDVPVRIVNVHPATGQPGDEMASAAMLESTRDALARRYPRLTLTTELVVGVDVAIAVAETARPASLLVIATDHAGADDGAFSVAEALVATRPGVILMVGPNARATSASGPIVVAQDGSAAALESVVGAVALHDAWKGPLWLVHVVDRSAAEKAAQLRAAGYAIQESAYVHEIADGLTDAGHRAGWAIVSDDNPATAVVRFAAQHDASLIAATTRGLGQPGERLFGSTCMRIVHQAPVPVVVMGTGSPTS